MFFAGLYYGIDFEKGAHCTMDKCFFVSNIKYGVYIRNLDSPDSGDHNISNCEFDTSKDTDAAIRHESSGGLKVSNTKILSHKIAYDLQISEGVTTSITLFSNCSIENQTNRFMRCGRLGSTGTFNLIAIMGSQFASATLADEGFLFSSGVNHVTLVGNLIKGSSEKIGVNVTGGSDHVVDNNIFLNWNTGIRLGSPVVDSEISRNNKFKDVSTTIEDNTLNTI